MHRIFSNSIGKSPRRDSPSFLASLVTVTDTPGDVTINKDSGTSSENKGGGASPGPAVATPQPHTNRLISFYTNPNGGRDSKGRTLSEILRFPDNQLEYHHDYIQWLFPLPEPSPYNWGAPKIDRATAQAFRTRTELRCRLRESLVRMLSFYGFEVTPASSAEGRFGIREGSDFQRKSRFWVCQFDHNHLRITRIIRCLRVLGLEREAKDFYEALVRVATPRPGRNGGVNSRTLMFWRRAARRPLQVPPEDEGYPDSEEEEEEEDGDDGGDDDDDDDNGGSGPELEHKDKKFKRSKDFA